MTTMIERVARAQAEVIFGKGCPLDDDDYVRARAAIEAMREPTDAMVDAGFDAGDDTVQGYSENADPQDTWQAMIDAALNEQVSG